MATAVPGGSSDLANESAAGRRKMRRRLIGAAARIVVVTGALVVVYLSAPIGERPVGTIAVRLLLAVVVVVAVLAWQIRSVARSPYPAIRGVEAVGVTVPLLVLTFATAYFATGHANPESFSETLSRLDAVYFSMTVLTTVGFGDIAAKSDPARLLVTAQMIIDLALGGLIAKVLVDAVRRRRDVLEGFRPG